MPVIEWIDANWDQAIAYLNLAKDPGYPVQMESLQRFFQATGDPGFETLRGPLWRVARGPVADHESALPALCVDFIKPRHASIEDSADNYCQFWDLFFVLAIAARGKNKETVERRCALMMGALISAWLGEGSYLNARDTNGLLKSRLDEGDWYSYGRKANQIAVARMLLTVRIKVQ